MAFRTLSVEEAIGYGWRAMRRNIGFLIVLLLVLLILWAVGKRIIDFLLPGWLEHSIECALEALVWMVLVWVALRLYDGRPHEVKRIFSSGTLVGNFILSQILYGLIIAGGVLLLVVPGLIWAAQFHYAAFVVIDEGLGPVEALKRSSELTRGNRLNLILFALVAFGVNLLGALCLGVGLLASIPTTVLADAWIYRRLQGRDAPATGSPEAVTPA